VDEQHDNPAVGLVLLGFSPRDRFAALARHLRWPGLVLTDTDRRVYQALGIGRAPLWRVYSPGTMLVYARAGMRGRRPHRPAEDTRQLGGDAVVVNGRVVHLWRPHSPDDRPSAATVLAAADAQVP
jgi:hypothetical protein